MRHKHQGQSAIVSWREWDTVREMITEALTLDVRKAGEWGEHDYISSIAHMTSQEWSYGIDYDKGLALLQSGWPDMPVNVNEIADKIIEAMGSIDNILTVESCVCGGFVNVPAYLAGVPDCMLRIAYDDTQTDGRKLKIKVSAGFNSTIDAESALYRGAAVLAMIKVLIAQGYALEIDATMASSSYHGGKNYYWVEEVPIVKSGEPIDVDLLSFVLCHAGFYRRIGFRLKETLPEKKRRKLDVTREGGYGVQVPIDRVCNAINEPKNWDLSIHPISNNIDLDGAIEMAKDWIEYLVR